VDFLFSKHALEQMTRRSINYEADGQITGIEILNASGQASNPAKVDHEFA
jgi:hypothetical protein